MAKNVRFKIKKMCVRVCVWRGEGGGGGGESATKRGGLYKFCYLSVIS